MKNIVTIVFLVIASASGMFFLAAVYFGVIFGFFDWLDGIVINDGYANQLGRRVGTVASVAGIITGATLALGAGWRLLSSVDGSPDWGARIAGIVVAVPLVLLLLYSSAVSAFDIVIGRYGGVGAMATVGFFGVVGWISDSINAALKKHG
jgi:hypothetical protein